MSHYLLTLGRRCLVGWCARPVRRFGQGVLLLVLPCDGVSVAPAGAGLAWSCEVLQTPPSLPGTPAPAPWTVRTSVCCLAMAFQAGPGQRQGLSLAQRFGDVRPQEGPGVHVLD